jgi:predicted outer membrane protein
VLILVVVGLLASVGPLAHPAVAQDDDLPEGWTVTPSGPLSPADVEVLVRVRLAGLWEGPAGALAQNRGGSARVKEVGVILETDHLSLDIRVREVAAELGVALPDQPNAIQREWLAELSSKQGPDFDTAFAEILRGAHGDIFAAIAFVRAGTRNDLVRQFAETGINVVMKHMTLLESTGIVNYTLLTPPPAPALPRVAFQERGDPVTVIVWVILGAAIIAGGIGVLRVMRSS